MVVVGDLLRSSSNTGGEHGEHGGHGGSRELGEREKKGSGAGGDGEQRLVGVRSSSPCRERTEKRGTGAASTRRCGASAARSVATGEKKAVFTTGSLELLKNITERSFLVLVAQFCN